MDEGCVAAEGRSNVIGVAPATGEQGKMSGSSRETSGSTESRIETIVLQR